MKQYFQIFGMCFFVLFVFTFPFVGFGLTQYIAFLAACIAGIWIAIFIAAARDDATKK